MGLSLLELCALLEETGRAVAPVPVLASLVLGGLPLARVGTRAQRERFLPALARGEAILTAALVDAGSADPAAPATRARREGARFLLDGEKRSVPGRGRRAARARAGHDRRTARASSSSIRARPACASRSACVSGRRPDFTPVPHGGAGAGRARRRGRRRGRAAALAARRRARGGSRRRRSASPSARSRSPPTT